MRGTDTGLALMILLVSSGCLGALPSQDETVEQADEQIAPANATEDEAPPLTSTVETIDLEWIEVHAVPPMAPIDPQRIEGENCVWFDVEGDTVVENGEVTVNWTSPDVETTPYTILRIETSDFGERVEHRLGPTHKEQPYTVDISGWNLTTDLPMDLMISFIAPTHFYASTEHHATVAMDIEHTGTMVGPNKSKCG